MINADVQYVRKMLEAGVIRSPCLELGVGYGGETNKALLQQANIKYLGTDMIVGPEVDYVVNFEESCDVIHECFKMAPPLSSALVLNVLEHTFDPIRILDNVFSLLVAGGTCVIITPTVWPLHNYPCDCWRINPNFYEEYCKRRRHRLLVNTFEYVGYHPVRQNLDSTGQYQLPLPTQNRAKRLWSRLVHKVFNTYGRGMFFPSHIATGVVIEKVGNNV